LQTDDFNYNGDPFPDPADIPSSGPPLLNSLENTFLGDFFFSQSQQTATSDFEFATALAQSYHHAQDQAQRFSEPDFNWLITEPPPTLVEAAPALPKSPTPPAHNFQALPMDFSAFSNNVPVTQSASTEVLNSGATTQPLHISPPTLVRAHTTSAVEGLHGGAIPAVVSPPYASAHSIPAPSPDLVFGFPKPLTELDPLNTSVAHDFGFSGPHTAPPLASRGEEYNSRLYRFGSDSHFAGNGFQPQNSSENAKAIEKSLLGNLYIIQPITHSAENTRGPTPENLQSRKRSAPLGDDDEESEEDDLNKRRRVESDDDRSALRRTSQANFKARRLLYAEHKRRRSSATAVKPPRENLSEEQKRSNHIMSEQKRRDLIKRGFEDLHRLVPELRAGGLSKSSVLMEAAAFLEKLVDVNAELRRRMGKYD